jgi:hypothetical protein
VSNSRRRMTRAARQRPAIAGSLLVGAGALLLAALVLAPWLAGRLSRRPYAPAVAVFVALVPAAYFWFRRVQRAKPQVALGLALAYAALAAGVLWVWNAR